jgi:hypothetical protein
MWAGLYRFCLGYLQVSIYCLTFVPVCLSDELSPHLSYFLNFDHRLDVEVSQTDEGNKNREGELEDVSEPKDVVRVETKLGSFHHVLRYIGLKMVSSGKLMLV